MKEHRIRLFAILVTTLAVLGGVIGLMASGMFSSPENAVLSGALLVLLPALVDANAVEQRRRDPSKKAIEDDRAE